MRKIINIFSFFISSFLIVGCGNSQETIRKKKKKMTLKELKTKHTETSIEGLETKITTLTLLYDKHSEKINDFIETATINKTNSLKVYLEAINNNNSKLIENINNKKELKSIIRNLTLSKIKTNKTDLTFTYSTGEVVNLNDVFNEYDITGFYPTFCYYANENGAKTIQTNPTNKPTKPISFKDEDILLSSGRPGDSNFSIAVYGNGEYGLSGSITGDLVYSVDKEVNTVRKAKFSSKEFDIILKKIKNIHLYEPSKISTLTNLPEEFIHDRSDIHYHL